MVNHAKLHMPLTASTFPFSKRMITFFDLVEVSTVAELAQLSLEKITCFRGFKLKCKQELIAFIEFEGIQDLFDGYEPWKEHWGSMG